MATAADLEELLRVPDAAIDRELCRRSLVEFVKEAWPVVEPAAEYVHGWHIDAICEHLEAVSRGEIRNLLINVPPRHMKSLSVGVFWPMWTWTHEPGTQWLYSANESKLATRDSRKARRLVQSDWYQQRWPLSLVSDQNVKTWFENEQSGYRLATTVAGAGTGHGGDVIVVDDPHKVQEADSRASRESVLIWWDEVMSSRLNDPETGAKVVVMQRVHENDLSGHVLEQGGYEHLMIPAEYEPDRACVTSLGWEDPREEDGELLWPERMGRDSLMELQKRLGPHGTAGQLQQRPTPRGGGTFDPDWFLPAADRNDVPKGCNWVRYWDKAGTEGGGAYTVGLLMAREPGSERAWIVDVVRGQWEAGKREQKIDETAEADAEMVGSKVKVTQVVEQEPGSGGKESALATKRRLSRLGYSADTDNPASEGNKFIRADPLAGAASVGDVKIVKGPWNQVFLREMEHAGPGAEYLDQMDGASGAYNYLADEKKKVRWAFS